MTRDLAGGWGGFGGRENRGPGYSPLSSTFEWQGLAQGQDCFLRQSRNLSQFSCFREKHGCPPLLLRGPGAARTEGRALAMLPLVLGICYLEISRLQTVAQQERWVTNTRKCSDKQRWLRCLPGTFTVLLGRGLQVRTSLDRE